MNYLRRFIEEHKKIITSINLTQIHFLLKNLVKLRKNKGRLFIIGVGGSSANASHAVNDFRKIVGIESYAPTDNVSELTARTNDEGWATIFVEWLKISRLTAKDMLFIFSVGGGNKKKKVSENLISAIDYAKSQKAKVFSFVGKKNGYAYKKSDISILIPTLDTNLVTPFSESFQVVLWHLLVSHPKLKTKSTKW
jgi:D-sedoheptulose 7-phosphate isomerase